MLVAKDIGHDARVRRSARSLAAHGYEVTVACKSTDGRWSTIADGDGYRILFVPILSRRAKARATKKSLGEVRAARLHLMRELDGKPSSPGDRTRLAELKRAQATLNQRYELLSRDRSVALEEPFRRAWGDVLRKVRPDVIHVHDHPGLATALSVRGAATPVIYDAHEHTLGKDLKPPLRPAIHEYLLRHAPRADAVITVGSAIAELLAIELELPSPPTVVHNTPSLRDAKPAPYDLRARIGLDLATPVLVYTGAITRRRRLSTAIRALARLPAGHLALILCGAKGRRELVEVAESLGVGERVHFPPPVPHDTLVSLIRTADVGIHPLDRYGNGDVAMPNKLFEYLHAGLPMVMSDSPQIASFVREHRLGAIASVDDPEAWAREITQILANRDAYRGDPAERAQLCREWSWEAQEEVLLELYDRLLKNRGGAVAADASPARGEA